MFAQTVPAILRQGFRRRILVNVWKIKVIQQCCLLGVWLGNVLSDKYYNTHFIHVTLFALAVPCISLQEFDRPMLVNLLICVVQKSIWPSKQSARFSNCQLLGLKTTSRSLMLHNHNFTHYTRIQEVMLRDKWNIFILLTQLIHMKSIFDIASKGLKGISEQTKLWFRDGFT